MARFPYFSIAATLIIGLPVGACAKLGLGSLGLGAPVAQSAPATQEAAQAAPKVQVVTVRVPFETAPAPSAVSPAIPGPLPDAIPTLPKAEPKVTNIYNTTTADAPKPASWVRVYGEHAIDLFNVLYALIGGGILAYARSAAKKAPVVVQAGIAMAGGVDSIVQELHDIAVNSIEGATKGKALDLNVGSSVLAKFLQLGVDKGPDFLASVGGLSGLKDKFMAVAHLGEDVSAEKLQAAQAV